jgi:hypothetical protein
MPRFSEYGADTVLDGSELLLVRSESQTRYATVQQLAEFVDASPGAGTPPVVIELQTETASFALSQATHAAHRTICDSASAIVVTVPANATSEIDVGCVFEFVRDGAGTVTFTPEGGVTINSVDGDLAIAAQYGTAVLVKHATDTWHLAGLLG